MKRIVFVNSLYLGKLSIPIGVLTLATILKNQGYDVQIIDFNYLYSTGQIKKSTIAQENFCYLGDYILQQKADIVGFSCMSCSYHTNLEVTRYIKEHRPELPIILGGPQASLTARRSMEAFPWIDLIALGETERTIASIVAALLGERDFAGVPGIVYRVAGQLHENPPEALMENVDELPMPDYSLLPYFEQIQNVHIEGGRGCPYGCIFCSTKTFWQRKFRLKSVKRLLEEFKTLYCTYNKTRIGIVHDLFTARRESVMEFCRALISANLPITWSCSARIDTLDEELITYMRQAGCNELYLGIETGSQHMQKLVEKNLDLSKCWQNIDFLQANGFRLTLSFMYGFPQETLADVAMTLNMIHRAMQLKQERVQLHLCSVFTGTEMYEKYRENLVYVPGYFSDAAGDINLEGTLPMILDNPEIFSHFYSLNVGERNALGGLDHFIKEFYLNVNHVLKGTYALLMRYYNNDLLEFFLDFKRCCPDFFMELSEHKYLYYSFTKKGVADSRLGILQDFINGQDFGQYTGAIRNVFQIELDVVEALFKRNENAECRCEKEINHECPA